MGELNHTHNTPPVVPIGWRSGRQRVEAHDIANAELHRAYMTSGVTLPSPGEVKRAIKALRLSGSCYRMMDTLLALYASPTNRKRREGGSPALYARNGWLSACLGVTKRQVTNTLNNLERANLIRRGFTICNHRSAYGDYPGDYSDVDIRSTDRDADDRGISLAPLFARMTDILAAHELAIAERRIAARNRRQVEQQVPVTQAGYISGGDEISFPESDSLPISVYTEHMETAAKRPSRNSKTPPVAANGSPMGAWAVGPDIPSNTECPAEVVQSLLSLSPKLQAVMTPKERRHVETAKNGVLPLMPILLTRLAGSEFHDDDRRRKGVRHNIDHTWEWAVNSHGEGGALTRLIIALEYPEWRSWMQIFGAMAKPTSTTFSQANIKELLAAIGHAARPATGELPPEMNSAATVIDAATTAGETQRFIARHGGFQLVETGHMLVVNVERAEAVFVLRSRFGPIIDGYARDLGLDGVEWPLAPSPAPTHVDVRDVIRQVGNRLTATGAPLRWPVDDKVTPYATPELHALGREHGLGHDVQLIANNFAAVVGEKRYELRGDRLTNFWRSWISGYANKRRPRH